MRHFNDGDIDPKEQQLFHYKDKAEHFYDMLRNGIWARFCEEDFTWLFGTTTFIAFPVVCFCDIPLVANACHRDTYGRYSISISKSLAGVLDIKPIWYLQQGTTITNHLVSRVTNGARPSLDSIGVELRPLLPFLKATIGCQAARNTQVPSTEVIAFEEEMEWRHTPSALMDYWVIRESEGFVKQNDEINNRSTNMRLKLKPDQIANVIVPNADDLIKVKREFPDLRGKARMWSDVSSAVG